MYHIFYNPIANNNSCKNSISVLEEKLGGDNIRTEDITAVSDIVSRIENMSEFDKFIIAGGDGTILHFITDIGDYKPTRDIFYYPAGSGNDFAHDIGKTDENGLILLNPYIDNLPTVTVNGKTTKFINGIGYGIDGYCCEVGDQLKLKSDKPINYAGIAIKGLLFHFKPRNATVTVDGIEHKFNKVWLSPCMNGRFYGGGMMVAPGQDRLNKKGTITNVVMYGSGKLKTLIVFPSIFKGEHIKHKEMISILEGHEITVKFDTPTALQIDGETVLGVTEYSIKSGKLSPVKKQTVLTK